MKKVITIVLITALSLAIAGAFILNRVEHNVNDGSKSVSSEKVSNADKTKATNDSELGSEKKDEGKDEEKLEKKLTVRVRIHF